MADPTGKSARQLPRPQDGTLALVISLVSCAATVAGAISGAGSRALVAGCATVTLLSVAWFGLLARRQLQAQDAALDAVRARLEAFDELLWPGCVAHLREPAITQGFELSRTPSEIVFFRPGSGAVVRAPIEPLEQPVVGRLAHEQLLDALRAAGFREPWRQPPLLAEPPVTPALKPTS